VDSVEVAAQDPVEPALVAAAVVEEEVDVGSNIVCNVHLVK